MKVVPGLVLMVLLCGVATAAEQKAVSAGLEITVSDANAEIDGYSSYTVTIKNTSKIGKTLSGSIMIQGVAGEACTIYGEAAAGQTHSFQMHCRGRGVWTFTPGKVYNMILPE